MSQQPHSDMISKMEEGLHSAFSKLTHLAHHHQNKHHKKPSYLHKCESNKRFQQMDDYGKQMILNAHALAAQKPFNGEMTQPFLTDEDYRKVLISNLGKYISKSDEDSHTTTLHQIEKHIMEFFLNEQRLFDEDLTFWKDAAESHKFQLEIATVPPVYIKYAELISNESLSQFAFSGLGCHHMKKLSDDDKKENKINAHNPKNKVPPNAVYMHDFSFLSTFKVRDGYEKYGATAYFDEKYQIIGIYHSETNEYVPAALGDYNSKWNHCKWAYKVSVFAAITVIDHLWKTHHTESQTLYECNIECLPCHHPLRHFIKPFVYRTAAINYLATQLLSNERGYVARLWAFPYTQIVRIFNYATMKYKFTYLKDFVDESMREEDDAYFPLYKDSQEFWVVIRNYVEGFLNIYYKNTKQLFADKDVVIFKLNLEKHLGLDHGYIASLDIFIDVLSQLICNGTGFHELVGQTSDYLQAADWIGTRLVKGSEIASVQEYGKLCALSAFTGAEQPKITTDWEYLFVDDDKVNQIKQNYAKFGKALSVLRSRIEKSNKTRKYQMQFFNPLHCKCSVSI